MNVKEMDRVTKHFETYFEQKCNNVLHSMTNGTDYHIDVLLFTPTEKYPFWKLATMGASDFDMPKCKSTLPNRNEYMIFIDKNIDLTGKNNAELNWYYDILMKVASFPIYEKTYISYCHDIEMPFEEGNMAGIMLTFPQVIENTGILRCKIGIMRQCACLQIMPITREELDLKLKDGAQCLIDKFYPEDESKPMHFLAEKDRTF